MKNLLITLAVAVAYITLFITTAEIMAMLRAPSIAAAIVTTSAVIAPLWLAGKVLN